MTWIVSSLLPTACWSVVIVVWIIGAIHSSRNAPQVEERSRRGIVPVAFVIIAVIAMVPLDWHPLHFGSARLEILGTVILLPSTAFTLWARISLGSMWSYEAVARKDHELRTEGPYSVTRHPIYTGLIGMLLGTPLETGQGHWVLILIIGTVILLSKAASEEKVMASTFREDYERYRERVPRIVPWPFGKS